MGQKQGHTVKLRSNRLAFNGIPPTTDTNSWSLQPLFFLLSMLAITEFRLKQMKFVGPLKFVGAGFNCKRKTERLISQKEGQKEGHKRKTKRERLMGRGQDRGSERRTERRTEKEDRKRETAKPERGSERGI